MYKNCILITTISLESIEFELIAFVCYFFLFASGELNSFAHKIVVALRVIFECAFFSRREMSFVEKKNSFNNGSSA